MYDSHMAPLKTYKKKIHLVKPVTRIIILHTTSKAIERALIEKQKSK